MTYATLSTIACIWLALAFAHQRTRRQRAEANNRRLQAERDMAVRELHSASRNLEELVLTGKCHCRRYPHHEPTANWHKLPRQIAPLHPLARWPN